jgi:hypothetical protein
VRSVWILVLATALLSTVAAGQAPTEPLPDCAAVARGTQQAAALASVCEFVLTLPQKLPNIVCDQTTIRYQPAAREKPEITPEDIITAQVTYEAGKESYENIAINGQPTMRVMPELSGMWSIGEFGSQLRAIFTRRSAAEFTFRKGTTLHATPALMFEFRVARQNNLSWLVQASGTHGTLALYPGYRGTFWLDKRTSHLLRLEMHSTDVDVNFPLDRIEVAIDYTDLHLGDNSEFLLPARSEAVSCTRGSEQCRRNVLAFDHCRKYAAKSRILPGVTPR